MDSAAVIIPSIQPLGPTGDRVIDQISPRNLRPLSRKLLRKQTAFGLILTYLLADHNDESQQLIQFIAALRHLKVSSRTTEESEKKLTGFFEDALHAKLFAMEDLVKLSTAILKLKTAEQIKHKPNINFTLDLLNKIMTQRRILAQQAYVENKAQIANFRHVYKLTLTDSIFRYAIGFNAGMGAGSVIYGIATALLLNPIVMGVSGGISLIVCVFITNYFLKSYNEEDEDLTTKLNNFDKTIQLHAKEEAALRLESYNLINQMASLISEVEPESLVKVKDHKDLIKLYATKGYQDPKAMDQLINKKLLRYSKDISTVAQVNSIQEAKPTSIYTRIFHSKHWGPILNFFGATGTLFGVTKSILAIVGITTLLSSPITLMAVIAAAAITVSIVFAYKHWRFNKLSEKRKEVIKDFEMNKMDGLTINTDKLKKLKTELQTNLQNVQRIVNNDKFKHANKKLALAAKKLTATEPDYGRQPASPTASPSKSGLFSPSRSETKDDVSVSKLNEEFHPRTMIAAKS